MDRRHEAPQAEIDQFVTMAQAAEIAVQRQPTDKPEPLGQTVWNWDEPSEPHAEQQSATYNRDDRPEPLGLPDGRGFL
ncbi:MAG: hypothetical protein WD738_17055 [Pirellulales bacterium]